MSAHGRLALAWQRLPRTGNVAFVTTMNVSLPDELKLFVDERVDSGYGSTSEYVRDLIRRDREREQLRRLILEGANSGPGKIADSEYFTSLRARISTDT